MPPGLPHKQIDTVVLCGGPLCGGRGRSGRAVRRPLPCSAARLPRRSPQWQQRRHRDHISGHRMILTADTADTDMGLSEFTERQSNGEEGAKENKKGRII